MQAAADYVESKECAVLRETLRSLEISIQRNTDLLVYICVTNFLKLFSAVQLHDMKHYVYALQEC